MSASAVLMSSDMQATLASSHIPKLHRSAAEVQNPGVGGKRRLYRIQRDADEASVYLPELESGNAGSRIGLRRFQRPAIVARTVVPLVPD